jgi:hypothetical protein
MHREFKVFSNVSQRIRKHCKYPSMLVKFGAFDMCFIDIFLNIEKRISYREFVVSALIREDPDISFSLSLYLCLFVH